MEAWTSLVFAKVLEESIPKLWQKGTQDITTESRGKNDMMVQ
jgi:hypothetical protein